MRLLGWVLVLGACSKSGDAVVADKPQREGRTERAAAAPAVTTSEGKKLIDDAGWDATDRTPILHVTGRGTLKYRWADKAGTWGPAEGNDVSRLEIRSAN